MRKTPLHPEHLAAGGRMVEFGGWEMPLHYGSQIAEHHAVRQSAGVFDVSHMAVIDVAGTDTEPWLQRVLANDVARLSASGRGLYSCMLNPDGGVIDDLIVYRVGRTAYRLIVNAATRESDLDWLRAERGAFDVDVHERTDLAMLAVQGPDARALAAPLLPERLARSAAALGRFTACALDAWFVARTGYTGEDGWEIVLPNDAAVPLWRALIAAGVTPAGLGARDTLRLEAGLNLYGQDMTAQTNPLESNLGWTIAWEPAGREFIGRAALEGARDRGVERELTGLLLTGKGVMRAGQTVRTSAGEGTITSGGFSPTIERSIALARLPVDAGERCEVEIRNRLVPARIVRPPFVRNGKILIDCGEN